MANALTPLCLPLLLLFACGQAAGPPRLSAAATQERWCDAFGFKEAEGWETRLAEIQTKDGSLDVAWASNTGLQDDPDDSYFPDATVKQLPPDGIVTTAVEPRRYTGDVDFQDFTLPIRLRDGYFLPEQYEGQPAPNVSTYVIDGWVQQGLLNVMVRMGRTSPTDQMKTSAEQQLARLCLP